MTNPRIIKVVEAVHCTDGTTVPLEEYNTERQGWETHLKRGNCHIATDSTGKAFTIYEPELVRYLDPGQRRWQRSLTIAVYALALASVATMFVTLTFLLTP